MCTCMSNCIRIWLACGSLWDRFGDTFGGFRDHFGSLWGHFWSFWGNFKVTLGHFGSFWGRFGAESGSDPVLDGSMCKSNMFCRGFFISKRSANQRKPAELSANQRNAAQTSGTQRRAVPFSINLSIHLISFSLSIYLSIY